MQLVRKKHRKIVYRFGALCALCAWLILAPAPAAGQDETAEPVTLEPAHVAGRIEAESGVSDPVRSPRNANYRIEATLDAEARRIDGRLIVEWRNTQAAPTTELSFHLYWNGWRNNQSTWLREDDYRGRSDRGDDIEEGDWSYQRVESIRLLSSGERPDHDLLPGLRYIAPDDGNVEDRTVFRVALPQPVQPGESAEVEIGWTAKIPRTFARTGFRGDFFFIAHWFPKLGVFENGAWTTPQFHSATEFYSDYGVYDVELTVPSGWVLGATGRKVERRDNGDGTTTHRHVQADVHGFTWTTSPDYVSFERTFEEDGLPTVEIRLLMQPEHLRQTDRHFAATEAALKYYGTWYGAYTYGHVTVIDPAFGAGAGGMEYPTIFTCGTRLFNPFGGGRPEGVTIHEAGHQFWYGIVGNNEFDYAWIDEGLNSFSDARVYDTAFGAGYYTRHYFKPPGSTVRRGFFPRLFKAFPLSREVWGNGLNRYRRTTLTDVQGTPTWRYHPGTASGISYSKTATWLHTLERYLGWETFQPIMSTFFDRWKFKHPTGEDFEAVVNEVSGQDLDWFFDQILRKATWFDYAVDSAKSRKIVAKGLFEEGGAIVFRSGDEDEVETVDEADDQDLYRSEVVVRRRGDGVHPVDVLMVFKDGTEARRTWDGRGRWKLFAEERASKLERVTVDPDRVWLLDVNYSNNSRVLKAKSSRPALKWASRWMLWLQDLMNTFAYYA